MTRKDARKTLLLKYPVEIISIALMFLPFWMAVVQSQEDEKSERRYIDALAGFEFDPPVDPR